MLFDEGDHARDAARAHWTGRLGELVGERVALCEHEAADHEPLELLAVQRRSAGQPVRTPELGEQEAERREPALRRRAGQREAELELDRGGHGTAEQGAELGLEAGPADLDAHLRGVRAPVRQGGVQRRGEHRGLRRRGHGMAGAADGPDVA
jgi:hypothetical protein